MEQDVYRRPDMCDKAKDQSTDLSTNRYRVFIKYCVFFPSNFVIILNSASSAAAMVFYLPVMCTHTDTEGKQRKARVQNILKSSEKKPIFNEYLT